MASNNETISGFRFHDFMKRMGRGVRPNLYAVELTLPPAINLPEQFRDKFKFMCRATSAPAFTIGMAEVPFIGRSLKLDGDRTFDDWTVTVLMSQDFAVRDGFEKWSDAIDGTVLADTSINPSDIEYFATGTISQLDKNHKVLKIYEVEGIWPMSVGTVDLAWDSNDQIATFDVTFAVNWIESDVTRNNLQLFGGNE